jgi:hypothetical protein
MNSQNNHVIRASEVGLYAYCARAWWLGRIEGHRPVNVAAMEAGEKAHWAHGRAVIGYQRLRQTAYVLVGLALLAGLALLVITLLK